MHELKVLPFHTWKLEVFMITSTSLNDVFAGALADTLDPVAASEQLPLATREPVKVRSPSQEGARHGSPLPASPAVKTQGQMTCEGIAHRHCCLE